MPNLRRIERRPERYVLIQVRPGTGQYRSLRWKWRLPASLINRGSLSLGASALGALRHRRVGAIDRLPLRSSVLGPCALKLRIGRKLRKTYTSRKNHEQG
jgi:hypothetical protein